MNPISILLIEDSPGDVELVREGLRLGKVANTLHVAKDGEEGINFLRQQGQFASQERPDLVLLDLNLPKKSGHEILHFVRNDKKLETLPIIILTTSENERDIVKGYQLHVNAYVTKPLRADDFLAAVKDIEEFWLALVTLPPKT